MTAAPSGSRVTFQTGPSEADPPALGHPSASSEASARLGAAVSRMGAVVLAAETVETVVALVVMLAAWVIPGTTGAGVILVDFRGTRTVAASDPVVEQAAAWEHEVDDGPCLTAWRDQVNVRADDLRADARWPRWSAEAVELGIRATLSFPLAAAGSPIGAIKVCSGRPEAYDGQAELLLAVFAQQAAVLLGNIQALAEAQRLSSDLRDALANRDVIGQAKGVLIAQGAGDEEDAFAMLVSASQRTHTKLHDVARQVVQAAADHRGLGRAPAPG